MAQKKGGSKGKKSSGGNKKPSKAEIYEQQVAELPGRMVISRPSQYDTKLIITIILSIGICATGFIIWIVQCLETGEGSFDYAHTEYHFLAIGLIGLFGPTSIYFESQNKKLEAMEDKFPDFLKDLAEYWKGGISMNVAIETLARGEYGGLKGEVKKMAVDISWGIAFSDVLEMFTVRVPTPLIKRSVALVKEANLAGGQISQIMLTAADDAREIRYLKEDKVAQLSAYSMVGYIAFFVYIAVIGLLVTTFLPSIAATTEGLGGGDDDTAQPAVGGITIHDIDVEELKFIFFGSTLVQATGIGLMSGAMTRGNISGGLTHCFKLVLIAYIVFGFAL